MLRISTEQQKNQIILRIEGKLINPWTKELEWAWQVLADALTTKRLFLDIRDITFVDQSGIEILGRIVRMANANVLADSPLTRQFADEARQFGINDEREK